MKPASTNDIGLLILAAGQASRMGKEKQLLPWKGKTLLEHAVSQALKLSTNVHVVLGAYAEKTQPLLASYPVQLIHNKEWEQGMGASLATGLHAMQKEGYSAALILLVDQPMIALSHYQQLIAHFRETPEAIIASEYPNGPGVPAVIPKRYFGQLSNLKGEGGAKKLMRSKDTPVRTIPTVGMLVDLDRPEDYEAAFSRWGS